MNALSSLVVLEGFSFRDSLSGKIEYQGAFVTAVWDFLWQK